MGKWLATDLRNVILGSDIETEFISMVYIFFLFDSEDWK